MRSHSRVTRQRVLLAAGRLVASRRVLAGRSIFASYGRRVLVSLKKSMRSSHDCPPFFALLSRGARKLRKVSRISTRVLQVFSKILHVGLTRSVTEATHAGVHWHRRRLGQLLGNLSLRILHAGLLKREQHAQCARRQEHGKQGLN